MNAVDIIIVNMILFWDIISYGLVRIVKVDVRVLINLKFS